MDPIPGLLTSIYAIYLYRGKKLKIKTDYTVRILTFDDVYFGQHTEENSFWGQNIDISWLKG